MIETKYTLQAHVSALLFILFDLLMLKEYLGFWGVTQFFSGTRVIRVMFTSVRAH